MTALALVVLGLAGGSETALSPQEKAIAEIRRLGGVVEFAEAGDGQPAIVTKVDLHGSKATDADLVCLEGLTSLRTLDLRLTSIGDEGVAHLRRLTELRFLNLFRSQLSDAGLASLSGMKDLETLLIGGTKVTDSGLAQLKGFAKLRKLSLFDTQVGDAGLVHLMGLSRLETLLIGMSKVTEAGTAALQKANPHLRFGETT